jgi:hypothetical protein
LVQVWPSKVKALGGVTIVVAAPMPVPTAMQNVAVGHDTAVREPVAGTGPDSDHDDPFHVSARAAGGPDAWYEAPTAKHHVAVGHETLRRAAPTDPGGRTGELLVQVAPFPVSASGWGPPDVGPDSE